MTANYRFFRIHSIRIERALGAAAVLACLAMTGCYNNDVFDEGKVLEFGSGQVLDFQSEEVSITMDTLNCAVDNGLFFPLTDVGSRLVARVTDKGRALGFSDDVSVDDPTSPFPYTQVRGKFEVEFKQVVRIQNIQEKIKRVEARAGLRIPNECFTQPLQLMGVRNGTIAQNNPAAFEFEQYGGDWHLMSVLH